jgi:hypothetical protein
VVDLPDDREDQGGERYEGGGEPDHHGSAKGELERIGGEAGSRRYRRASWTWIEPTRRRVPCVVNGRSSPEQ